MNTNKQKFAEHEVDSISLLAYLRYGWELKNLGNGWWVSEKQIPYKTSKKYSVSDEVVGSLEEAGLIKFKELTRSFRAELIEG